MKLTLVDLLRAFQTSRKNSKNRWSARINRFGKEKHLGCFDTEEAAFDCYRKAKAIYVAEIAEKWKGKIDDRVYEALMKWEVSIDDQSIFCYIWTLEIQRLIYWRK